MFTNKDNFAIYLKIQEVRSIYSNFKSSVLVQLEKLENQIETIIYELSQRDELDSICQNIIENDNSTLNDDEVQEIAQIWNKISYQKNNEYFPRFSDQLVTRIQKTLKLWEQQIQETLQMDLRIIPIYSQSLYKFDLTNKFQSIQINEEIMIEQTQSQTHYCFALTDQQLNSIETSTIQFRFPKFVGDIGVGICDLQILKTKNFRPQLNQVNNGAFVCFQDSYTINTEQDEYNWKTKGFKFGERDVIQVTYEPTIKRVTWIKVQKPEEGYSVVLLNDKRELYFCCIVKTLGAKVEIVGK
ncbi:unnamed protein product (macronuclear) [Paramecium tetraurelia]|uniref:Uncharacterized protein n=1 Tax=Paramecium tetraurelia TaxID=5888 RepID=A0BV38_PARTE|nr:uncharacterized protein GSPATT00005651001 [Paramecium tetraurelia]CAK62405.1 unnamed protein product [Paramecium tetraurelia]|eukprot:XP_001429803.1 hypothetical protein (macronuclear) [Paramecium tetraurelia strain d4-2]